MEDDIENLEKALHNLETTEPQEEKSDFEGLYKNWGKTGSQEERRAQLLQIQKVNRKNKIDKFRGILELVNAVEDSNKIFKTYKKIPYRPNIYVAGFHKTSLTYSNVLMLSEWMIEKPCDFAQNWYVVPCPKGVRVLAVANNGTTKFYTKYGHFKFERYTGLPGGNPYNFYRKNCCVLDCFYYEPTNTLYLLDLLAWNDQPMTDGETEFRHYWMTTQLENFPYTKTVNKRNKVIIKILPMMPCTTHYISYMLSTYPYFENNSPPMDGLLFYHKKAHYVAGETPLVGWLFPYMITEVLGSEFTMNPGYLAEQPHDYVNQADFIQKFHTKYKKEKSRTSRNSMETNTSNVEQNNTMANEMETDKKVEKNKENMKMEMDSAAVQNKGRVSKKESMETDKDVKPKTRKENNILNKKSESSSNTNTSMDAEEQRYDGTETAYGQ